MNVNTLDHTHETQWFAIRTRQDFRAEKVLGAVCDEVFFPKKIVAVPGKRAHKRAIIPHVLFIKTSLANALALEADGRKHPDMFISFWIYRYPKENKIQVISQHSIDLLRLLSMDGPSECEIFNKTDFRENEHVRVIGGDYKGHEGYVQRVKKNKHVVIKIEGICMVMLPFIPPSLLEKIG